MQQLFVELPWEAIVLSAPVLWSIEMCLIMRWLWATPVAKSGGFAGVANAWTTRLSVRLAGWNMKELIRGSL
jgi:hypothetical protein